MGDPCTACTAPAETIDPQDGVCHRRRSSRETSQRAGDGGRHVIHRRVDWGEGRGKGAALSLFDVFVPRLDEQPNGRWSGVELVDFETFHHLPIPPGVWVGWDGFKQHRGCTIQQWSVRDVPVRRDQPSRTCKVSGSNHSTAATTPSPLHAPNHGDSSSNTKEVQSSDTMGRIRKRRGG
jgi:hypothetical protein